MEPEQHYQAVMQALLERMERAVRQERLYVCQVTWELLLEFLELQEPDDRLEWLKFLAQLEPDERLKWLKTWRERERGQQNPQ